MQTLTNPGRRLNSVGEKGKSRGVAVGECIEDQLEVVFEDALAAGAGLEAQRLE